MTNTTQRVRTIRPVPLPLSRAEEDCRVNEQTLVTEMLPGTHVRQIGCERDGLGVVIAVRGADRKILWDNYCSQWLRVDKLAEERDGK